MKPLLIDFAQALKAALVTAALTSVIILAAAIWIARGAEPTPAQIDACMPDALRLCPAGVVAALAGNHQIVTDCMRRNHKLVSKQCRDAWK